MNRGRITSSVNMSGGTVCQHLMLLIDNLSDSSNHCLSLSRSVSLSLSVSLCLSVSLSLSLSPAPSVSVLPSSIYVSRSVSYSMFLPTQHFLIDRKLGEVRLIGLKICHGEISCNCLKKLA